MGERREREGGSRGRKEKFKEEEKSRRNRKGIWKEKRKEKKEGIGRKMEEK